MLKPFFSIIIPALNESRYLPKLLGDLSAQTFRDFEVIVVDGHSDDATVAKAKALASSLPRLTILNSPRRHVCTQRNLGTKHARADIFIFMDADNRLPPYFLQGIKYRLEVEPADLATTWISSDKSKSYDDTIAKAVNYAVELAKNFRTPFFPESMTICQKQVFKLIGGFDETINYAESRQIAHTAIQHGFRYTIYKDPTYTYSFRRIRKYGPIRLAGTMAQHQLAMLLGTDLSADLTTSFYPMRGGKFFDKPYRKKQDFINNIRKLLQDL